MRTSVSGHVAALATAILLSTTSVSQADLVANGGFESGNFSGWTPGGSTVFNTNCFVLGSKVHSGTYAAWLGPNAADGSISQTLAATSGEQYSLSFWLRNDLSDPGNLSGPANFHALWEGSDVYAFSSANAPASPYTQYTFVVTAHTVAPELAFSFRNVPDYWKLDDVSVVGYVAAVPLPTSAFIGMGGLAFVASLRLARRRSLSGV